jgi:hypothetical protein
MALKNLSICHFEHQVDRLGILHAARSHLPVNSQASLVPGSVKFRGQSFQLIDHQWLSPKFPQCTAVVSRLRRQLVQANRGISTQASAAE